ncbi:MAG: RNA polymerase sigma factor [Oscillospiraceae bacterium]|nr:RNA polymerase sigma factor [Oscillospiraceae bacterium]
MEREQIALLYEAYGDDVYRLALSWLRNRQDAEDVCQSVFLKLMDRNTVLFPGKEKAWLLTCTANACKNHLSAFRRRNMKELDESIVFCDSSDRELWDAVMRLPPRYRAVIHLCYYEGYSHGEIAKILGISLTAVQTRMSRARKMLKKELKDDAEKI